MDERALQFRVGAMVVGTVFIAVLLLIIFNYSPSILRGRNTIYIKFAAAPGVTQDTPIRKSGVLIGRVSDVTLRDRDVLVTAKIDRKYHVFSNETCRIGTESLLGDSMLEFVSLTPGDLGQPIGNGALIEGRVQEDAFGTMELASYAIDDFRLAAAEFRQLVSENRQQASQVLVKSETALDDVSLAANKFSRVADQWATFSSDNEAQLTRLVSKSEQAMDSFQLAMNNINSLVGDEQMRRDLQASISTVPLLLEETRVAVSKYSAVADRADQSLKDAEGFTKSLGDLGDSSQQMAKNIDEITGKLDRLVLDLLTMSDAINKQEGTLGQLVYNPELYQRLNRAAGNVEQISYRLRPIVEDVRVFSHKIARDPGRLGLKGALERNQTGGKFFPFGNMRRSTPQPTSEDHWSPPQDIHYDCEVQPQMHLQPAQLAPAVQPAGHQIAVPQWSPTRPSATASSPTTPQQFWQSQ